MPAAAFSTEFKILLTMDSSNGFSTRMRNSPEILTHPETASEPSLTATGTGSPVTAEVSIRLSPSMTTPSNGIRSPGRTCTISPAFASSAGISVIWPSFSKRTTSGLKSTTSMIWLRLFSTATSSKNSPILKNSITPTASGYLWIANDPSVAILIRKFSSNIWPFKIFLPALKRTSPPKIR